MKSVSGCFLFLGLLLVFDSHMSGVVLCPYCLTVYTMYIMRPEVYCDKGLFISALY